MWHSMGVANAAESQGSGVMWKGCHLPRVQLSARYRALHRLCLWLPLEVFKIVSMGLQTGWWSHAVQRVQGGISSFTLSPPPHPLYPFIWSIYLQKKERRGGEAHLLPFGENKVSGPAWRANKKQGP